jgi:hypothetical protein
MELRFADEYAIKNDDELIGLWADRESLLPEAREALDVEIRNRRIDIEPELRRLANVRRAEERHEARVQLNKKVKRGYQQFGRGRIGRGNYVRNENSGLEEFDQTEFFFLFWLPLVPLRTYRIQRSRKLHHSRTLREVPVSWRNVREIWARTAFFAALIALVIALAWRFVLPHLTR